MLDPFSGNPLSSRDNCEPFPKIPIKSYGHRPPLPNTGLIETNRRITSLYEKLAKHEEKLLYIDNTLDTKVDKVPNKGLSTEDYTTEDKTKLDEMSSSGSVWSLSEW